MKTMKTQNKVNLNEFDSEEATIDLKDWRDLEMMKNLYNTIKAYKILCDQEQRD